MTSKGLEFRRITGDDVIAGRLSVFQADGKGGGAADGANSDQPPAAIKKKKIALFILFIHFGSLENDFGVTL
ncbi:hypothetical protein KFK09_024728 [Dendrobium nobile]|uniref:Uncharacterized protein n=1 Tax=Dendrobium nobile TaxID=94219 RepID=A0A8T3ADX4_DENNO|nr:hypothetical protein KFK09_024728 [Dendrobium nobile]